LDLLYAKEASHLGVEFKYTSSPSVTKSMRIALNDLNLSHLYVVHPGRARFPLAEKITVIGLFELVTLLDE